MSYVKGHLPGEKNGRRTGMRLNTAVTDVEAAGSYLSPGLQYQYPSNCKRITIMWDFVILLQFGILMPGLLIISLSQ